VRFYPDQVLSPDIFVNPSSNHSGADVVIRSRFNLANPGAGDPVVEDSTAYLRRWLQWMLEVQNVDGFRLDASKHVFPFWWDTHFDSAVFNARTTPDGRRVTPFSFGENTTGNFDMLSNYIRKDAFANRDALDLNGAARLAQIVGGSGFGSWADIFANADAGHLDQADDGLQNGSMGVFHVFSHDNGSVGDGGSLPPIPSERQQGWFAHAYMLMRPGLPIVYHNGRGIPRSFGFFPREGTPVALGWDPIDQEPEDSITRLVTLRNMLGTGNYYQRNGNIADVLVYERATNPGGGLVGNVLVAVNDRYDAGFDTLTVGTTFPAGTRLIEYTGNAADPTVDPSGQIPDVLTVAANGTVGLAVPRNRSAVGEHNRGFLVYAPAVPAVDLTIVGTERRHRPRSRQFPRLPPAGHGHPDRQRRVVHASPRDRPGRHRRPDHRRQCPVPHQRRHGRTGTARGGRISRSTPTGSRASSSSQTSASPASRIRAARASTSRSSPRPASTRATTTSRR
jgi:hypothetical protein